MELLSAASRAHLETSAQAEIRSISAETDPQLASEAWLDFARRQETAGRLEAAAEIYNGLLASTSPGRSAASERLAVLSGSGPFGSRFEWQARRFVREAADPAMIVGMGAAATVSSLVRFGTLSRLLASPTATVFTRGAGARWLAASAAFVPEVGAFWGASRATRSLLSPEVQAWDL
ncbi:MAG: hypothetical protein K8R69_02240, partial [Deltaproteobacteria bacterium]|nr:hypothetical protein [Deltaproteobacteria bacterium]